MFTGNPSASTNSLKRTRDWRHTSTKSVKKTIYNDLRSIAKKEAAQDLTVNPDIFIPFVQERNSMGKLLNSTPGSYFLSKRQLTPSQTCHKAPSSRLFRRDNRTRMPCVGNYNLSSSWIKPSFSRQSPKRPKSSYTRASADPKTESLASPKPTPPAEPRPKTSILFKQWLQKDSKRITGIWESMKVYPPAEVPSKNSFDHQTMTQYIEANLEALQKLEEL